MRWYARTNDGDELDKGAAKEFSVYARQRLPTAARDGSAKQLLISIELLWPLLPNVHKS